LTGLIVAIGGLAGLITALDNAGIIGVNPTDTPTSTYTFTPSPTSTITPSPSPSPTLSPTVTSTPEVAIQLELCLRNLSDNVIVREGPDLITAVLEQLPSNSCLNFDLRQFDNSWIRIAEEQSTAEAEAVALGWIIFDAVNATSTEIEHLAPYIPNGAIDGLYCVLPFSGSKVRNCPNTSDSSCPSVGTLDWHACLYFDGRIEDSTWLRIAAGQGEEYSIFTGRWVNSDLLVVNEFLDFLEKPRMKPYFELLPIVTPPPTPEG
jgi:hypothetical protein